MTRLGQRRAIVTGGGSGIGRSIVRRFLAEGARVLAVDRDPEGLIGTAAACAEAGPALATLALDLTGESAPVEIVARAGSTLGGIDILVNNAGIAEGLPLHLTEDAVLDRTLDVNLRSLFRLSREVVRVMRAGGGGAILNIASVYGLTGAMRTAAYSASKAAVVGLTVQMATDYGRDGIRVNALAPGLVETPLTAPFLANEGFRRAVVEGSPLGRIGDVEEVAAAALFLCSDEAGYITGEVIRVDGGWSAARLPPERRGG